jgi:hypothetical protein
MWKVGAQMSLDHILSKLDDVKRSGRDKYIARCPAHADRSPSLSIKLTDDGRTLLHCFSGCAVHEITGAIGLQMSGLFPPRDAYAHDASKPIRPAFSANDVLACVAHQCITVLIAARQMTSGSALSEADYETLSKAVTLIQNALALTKGVTYAQ